jgi:Phage integrase central domain
MELCLFPWIGARPIGKLSARDILTCLQRVEAGAKLETAKRALQNCSRIFRYAIATGRAEQNPAVHLMGALPPARKGHLAAITTPRDFGELLRAIEAYNGSFVVRVALQLAPLVFVRPGELSHHGRLHGGAANVHSLRTAYTAAAFRAQFAEIGGNYDLGTTATPNSTPTERRQKKGRGGDWWPGRELNPRHADFQSAALPTELPGRTGSRIRHRPRRIVNYGL